MEISIEKCLEMLDRGESFVLATVIATEGSTPRGVGARMTVTAGGDITGTVGGGTVEAMTIKAALKSMAERRSTLCSFSLSLGNPNSIGMICGGSVEVLVEYIDAGDPVNGYLFGQVLQCLAGNTAASLVTVVERNAGRLEIDRSVFPHDNLPDQGLPPWFPEGGSLNGFQVISVDSTRQIILEELSASACICIFGAGHIGLKLAELAKFVGQKVIVVDDRPDFATRIRYPHAEGVYTIEGYLDVFDSVPVHDNSYIVIVTKDSNSDRKILEQSLKTKARYIGMIGSRTKISTIFESLRKSGVTTESLSRVNTPIGMPIDAETPAEISISIMGEIIKKNHSASVDRVTSKLSA
ncbi:MAG: hypothetical protein H6Q00_1967 [Holophagaceae bacterium]|nr:hypothetical protein [Holophagaceae bacterium]